LTSFSFFLSLSRKGIDVRLVTYDAGGVRPDGLRSTGVEPLVFIS
jgi:hypothetical protein